MELNKNILDDYFQDGMVLPQEKSFYFGGTVNPEESVVLTFLNKKYKTQSDTKGKWRIKINPIAVLPLDNQVKVYVQHKEQVISNLHLGQVYLLSGQSNIEFRLKDDANFEKAKKLLSNEKYSNLYYYNVPQIEYINPETGEISPDWVKNETWKEVTVDNCEMISDVGFWMMIQLRDQGIKDPIAVVGCFKGGTSASVWITRDNLAKDKLLNKTYILPYHKAIDGKNKSDFDKTTEKYNAQVAGYNKKFDQYQRSHPDLSVNAIKAKIGDMPWPPPMRPELFMRPGGLHRTMMEQIQYSSFTSMVWYQGEDDRFYSESYNRLLPLLINTWREYLHDQSLPINIIQLPGYADYPNNSGAVIRQVQLDVTQRMPSVRLVSFVDGGEEHNIHPEHKEKMGRRLGRIVSGQSYAQTPYVADLTYDNTSLVMRVACCYQLKLRTEASFTVKYLDGTKTAVKIKAEDIKNNLIVLNFDKKPSLIKYGYENFPSKIGLFNELGDPISPFILKVK